MRQYLDALQQVRDNGVKKATAPALVQRKCLACRRGMIWRTDFRR